MKKLLLIVMTFIACQSCIFQHQKKYYITLYRDQFEPSLNQRRPHNIVDSIEESNDTAAYLSALKKFYDQKIEERKISNWGEPKSFIITDKNGKDLADKLSIEIKTELTNQVKGVPKVKKMLDAYQRDSGRVVKP
jgi:hypothetical protein